MAGWGLVSGAELNSIAGEVTSTDAVECFVIGVVGECDHLFIGLIDDVDGCCVPTGNVAGDCEVAAVGAIALGGACGGKCDECQRHEKDGIDQDEADWPIGR